MFFCPAIKRIAKGIATSKAPAANIVKLSFALPLISSNKPTARVFFASLLSTSRGKIKSIQGPVKLTRVRKTICGRAEGTIILKYVANGLAPSTRAAYSILRGIESK